MASGQVAGLQTPRRFSNFFPSSNGVSSAMFSMRHKFEIFKSIVESILVSVVNIFASCQSSSKMLFHHISMLCDLALFSIFSNSEKSVSSNSNRTKTTLSTKRNERISPSFHLRIMTVAQSFCSRFIHTLFNGTLFINSHNGIRLS